MNKVKQNKQSITNMLLYGFGSGISQFGTQIYVFAIGLYVLNITGSALSFAITMAVGLLPTIVLSPVAGVLSDKFNKKKIVVSMDILNGLLFIGLYVYMTFFQFHIVSIYIVSFLAHVCVTFFSVSFESAKPQMVDSASLGQINSLSQILMAGTAVLSPFIGGIIYAFVDIRLFIVVNGISFLISAFMESMINFNHNRQEKTIDQSQDSFIGSLKAGWDYMIHKSSLVGLLGLFAVANFLFSFSATIPLPYILNNHIGMTPEHYGITNSFMPLGMILGAVMVGYVVKKMGHSRTLYLSMCVSFGVMGLLGLPYLFPILIKNSVITVIYYSGILAIFGISISIIDVPILTIIQSTTDEAYRGRVISLMITVIKAINPIAYLLSGLALKLVNPLLLPLVGGLVSLMVMFMYRSKIMGEKYDMASEMI